MLAVDTNVLVRVLVDDPGAPAQVAVARKAVTAASRVFIPDVVLVETVWALKQPYGFSKDEILGCFVRLLENERFVWDNWEAVSDALAIFVSYNVDFADCLILAKAKRAGAELLTFDRKLGRVKGVRRLH